MPRATNDQAMRRQARHGGLPAPVRPTSCAKVGRNDPCPCGSGKKYKQCHGKLVILSAACRIAPRTIAPMRQSNLCSPPAIPTRPASRVALASFVIGASPEAGVRKPIARTYCSSLLDEGARSAACSRRTAFAPRRCRCAANHLRRRNPASARSSDEHRQRECGHGRSRAWRVRAQPALRSRRSLEPRRLSRSCPFRPA